MRTGKFSRCGVVGGGESLGWALSFPCLLPFPVHSLSLPSNCEWECKLSAIARIIYSDRLPHNCFERSLMLVAPVHTPSSILPPVLHSTELYGCLLSKRKTQSCVDREREVDLGEVRGGVNRNKIHCMKSSNN